MTVRRIDTDTGDIVTSGQQFIDGRFEIGQTVVTRLRLFLNEYFRDTSEGTPWFQNILGKTGDLNLKEATLKRRITQTVGVVGLLEFDTNFDFDARTYSVTASVLTTFGQIAINETGLING